MAHFPSSKLWKCHRSIEDYCTKQTETLMDHIGVLFADMTNQVNTAQGHAMFSSALNENRRSMDKIRMLVHIRDLQLEVLRRVTEKTQDKLTALINEKSYHLKQAASNISNSLPTLPNEIITQIFQFLYWLDRDFSRNAWGAPIHPNTAETTLRRLINDKGMPSLWKELIQRQIPVAIMGSGIESSDVTRSGLTDLVGSHPEAIPANKLTGNSRDIFLRTTTTIYVNLYDFPNLKEDLDCIRQFPWHNFVFTTRTETAEEAEKTVKAVLQNYGRGLADSKHLVFPKFWNDVVLTTNSSAWSPSERKQLGILTSKLKYAYVPRRLLPVLNPIFSNLAVLEIGLTSRQDFPRVDILAVLECLESCLETLINFTISNSKPSSHQWTTNDPSDDVPVQIPIIEVRDQKYSFPRLEQLKFASMPLEYVVQMLSVAECPSLAHFTHVGRKYEDRIDCVPITLLHGFFPKLKSINMDFCQLYGGTQFLLGLETPDADGNWRLPVLETIILDGVMNLLHRKQLQTVTRVVANRLRSDAAKPIRSLSLNTEENVTSVLSVYLRTLKLLVPEVISKEERSWGW